MEILLLHTPDCPHMMPALRLLREAMQECGVPGECLRVVEVRNLGEAAQYRFPGSPTIQVDGDDIEVTRRNDPPAFVCRVYRNREGLSGVPEKEMILKALQRDARTPGQT